MILKRVTRQWANNQSWCKLAQSAVTDVLADGNVEMSWARFINSEFVRQCKYRGQPEIWVEFDRKKKRMGKNVKRIEMFHFRQ